MPNLIIGTAGHVDHGKTELIKALTGIDTDRLPEEKARGMSIDIGFAHFKLPSGSVAGIIDVPGHERFVHNMLAGAAGMDLVLLVVAADEGVMPQTVEHLEILELLETKQGAVVITKKDLVDEEWLELVTDDIQEKLKGTFLENAPTVAVSSVTKEGLDDLVKLIDELCVKTPPKDLNRPFRLPIDQAFVKQGFGTIIRGTAFGGRVRVGEEIEVVPKGLVTRVRTLQVHGRAVEEASAGQRVAMNLSGVEREDIERGDVVCVPGSFLPTTRVDVRLRLLANAKKPLADGAPVHFHVATAERVARVFFFDCEELAPGGEAFAQLRFEEPIACARGDRFVIRSYSPIVTIGGGVIVEPYPKRRRRHDPSIVRLLERKALPDNFEAAQALLEESPGGLTVKDLQVELNLTPAQALELTQKLLSDGAAVQLGENLMRAATVQSAASSILQTLDEFHRTYPLRRGMPKEQLKVKVPVALDDAAFEALLQSLQHEGKVAAERETVSLPTHKVELTGKHADLAQRIERLCKNAGFTPPETNELLARFPEDAEAAREVLLTLLDQSRLVRLEDMLFHQDTIAVAQKIISELIRKHGNMTVAQFRDATGTSRKYAVPLLEHLDRIGFTKRIVDVRVLRG